MLIWELGAILEKNKIANDRPFLILLQIDVNKKYPDFTEPIRLVRDGQQQTWNNNLYLPFPFDFDDINEDGKEMPKLTLKVANTGGVVASYIRKYNGFCDVPVKLIVVHEAHLDKTAPLIEMDFLVNTTGYDEEWVKMNLGAANDHKYRFPPWKYYNDFCFLRYKEIRCGYNGDLPPCDGTLNTCRIARRFGGEPGLATGGV